MSMYIKWNICALIKGDISTLNGSSLNLVEKLSYLGSSVSSIKTDVDTRLSKAWTAFDRLSVIWKSDLTDKMMCSFFQAAAVSILKYGCIAWTLTKRNEIRLIGNYTRMLRAILSWRQHPTSSTCTATYHSSRKLSLDDPVMRYTAGEVGTSS